MYKPLFSPAVRPLTLFTLLALSASLLSACGGGDGDGGAPAVPQVSTALDVSFAQQGRFALDLGEHGGSVPAVAEQADGKLLLVLQKDGKPLAEPSLTDPGLSIAGRRNPTQVQVLRLLDNGSPDPSFGQQGKLNISVLGAERVDRLLPLPDGSVRLSLTSFEPCTYLQRVTGGPNPASIRCMVDAGSSQERLAHKTFATAIIQANGQLDANSVDVNQLTLEDATGSISPQPNATQANNAIADARHIWTASGFGYPFGNLYSWGITRSLLPTAQADAAFGTDGHWQSACTSDAGQFARDAAGNLWTASSITSSSSSENKRGVCLERLSSDGKALWATPVNVPLNVGAATVQTIALLGQIGHITATSTSNGSSLAHTVQVNENGSLRSSYGQQGVARTELPGALSQVRYESDGAVWLHSRNGASGQNHLQQLNAQGVLNTSLGQQGVLTLDGAAARSELRLIDRQLRWLMLSGDASQNTLGLIRIQGNAAR